MIKTEDEQPIEEMQINHKKTNSRPFYDVTSRDVEGGGSGLCGFLWILTSVFLLSFAFRIYL